MSVDEIFLAALKIADRQQRQEFLDLACGTDSYLRKRLAERFDSHEAARRSLNVPDSKQLHSLPGTGYLPTVEIASGLVPSTDMPTHSDEEVGPDLSFLQFSSKPGSIGRLGHYEILHVLGQGGFGIVLKAFDEKLHRLVAIKVMPPQLAATSPPRQRFLREARAVAALKHENIIQIYSVEEQPLPYLAMEFVDGQTLQDKLDSNGPLGISEFLQIGRQIAAGLADAHAKGLIHRDVKPGNILLESAPEPKVKITDFGLARAADDATMTQSGTIAGTPLYMAPEQAQGESLDHRADLFSLGSVFYEMVSGRPPFRAANTLAVLKRVCEDSPRPIHETIPGTPAWLETIIFRLLKKNPDERFQSAHELVNLLARSQEEFLRDGQVSCVTSSGVATTVPKLPPASANEASRTAPRSPLIWSGAALACVGAVVAFWTFNNHNSFSPPSVEPPSVNAGFDQTSVPIAHVLKFDGVDDYVIWKDLPFPKDEPFKVELSATIDELPSEGESQSFLLNWDLGMMVTIPKGGWVHPRINVEFNSAPGVLHQFMMTANLEIGHRFDLTVEFRDGIATFQINGQAVPEAQVWYRLRVNGKYVEDAKPQAFQPAPLNSYCFLGINTSQLPARDGNGFTGKVHRFRVTKGDGELVADFDFSRNSGETLRDLSGKVRDGKIVGAQWEGP